MKPLLKMMEHSENDIYIYYGNETPYRESFGECIVEKIEEKEGKRIFHLGMNMAAFKILNTMFCGMADRTFH